MKKRLTQTVVPVVLAVLGLFAPGRSCQAANPDAVPPKPDDGPVVRAPQVASTMTPAGMPEIHRVKI